MKILLITDTHFGVRNGNEAVERYQAEFFHKQLFPYIEEHKKEIDLIIHLGDLFDQRKYISYKSLDFWYKNFVKPMNDFGLPIHLIVGNHDCTYRETNSLNSPFLLLKDYKRFTVFNEPWMLDNLLYLPWINKENFEQTKKMIQASQSKICLGHLQLSGFLMMSGQICEHSELTASDFLKFQRVFSGHFHWRSGQKNIEYLGSPFQLNWADIGNDRGFHMFDTEKNDLTFIHNPLEQYVKLEYDDTGFTSLEGIDFSEFKDKFVKLIVKTKVNPLLYTKFVQSLQDAGVVQLQITDQELQKSVQEQSVSIKTIPEIISNNIDIQDFAPEIKSRLLEFMTALYGRTLC